MSSLPAILPSDIRWAARLQMCIGVFSLILGGATWPLWWPVGEFPVIPWFRSLISAPLSFERGLAIGLVISSVVMAVLAARQWVRADAERTQSGRPLYGGLRCVSAVWLACLAGSVLLDQQRFQVWAWEFFWLTMFLNLASPRVARSCCRVLVIGIYFYSAISKIDFGFVQAQGPWLWQGLQRAIGIESKSWGGAPTLWMLAFPLGELLAAGLLSVQRTWRWGIFASWVMHGTLLLTLGPLGWNQKPGVLLWNVFFLITVPMIFREPMTVDSGFYGEGPNPLRFTISDRLCRIAVLGLSLWPALEVVGLCDHWPAWAVYSSRPEIVTIEVPEEQVGKLPASLQTHIGPPQPLSSRRPISIDHWSFEQRHCPIYPNARYRLAVARSLEDRYGVHLRVTEQSPPARWTGIRQVIEVTDLAATLDRRFWFNTRARVDNAQGTITFGDRMIALTAQWAVAGYAIAVLFSVRQRSGERPSRSVAFFWTAGLVGLAVHMVCAFHFLHHWSHSAALKHTALRTFEVTGWSWAGGLYINYAFLLFWIWEAVRLWRESLGLAPVASLRWRRLVHSVFLFMMFNATVVFGPWHWTVAAVAFGLVWLCLVKSATAHSVVLDGLSTPQPPAGDQLG
ncbi:MAG: hypothetical protein DWH81_14860 [Planctomycetota bacterium]|nr:MAG: hypothetical protein DWH81_14860 [Planctomycetota bacterium]